MNLPASRTVCFPYPGEVTVTTPDGPVRLGDVILTVALWVEAEHIPFDEANRVEYSSGDIDAIQRVEFSSQRRMGKNQRISLQLPKLSESIRDLRAGFFQPSNEK